MYICIYVYIIPSSLYPSRGRSAKGVNYAQQYLVVLLLDFISVFNTTLATSGIIKTGIPLSGITPSAGAQVHAPASNG